MTILTLHQLKSNPDSLKSVLYDYNLAMIEHPASEWNNITPTENSFSYCESKFMSATIKTYTLLSENIFYSILFPNYSVSEINQLKTLFKMVESVLKKKSTSYNCYNKFKFAHNDVTAATSYITIKSKHNQLWLSHYSTVSLGNPLLLADLKFEKLYTVILNDFNEKVNLMLTSEIEHINTKSMNYLQDETNEDYIKRTHKDRIVKAIKVDYFKKHIEELNFPIKKCSYDIDDRTWDANSMSIADAYGVTYFIVGIHKICSLKTMLLPLMNDKDITQLIHLLSIAHFYSNLFDSSYHSDTSKNPNNFVEFTHCDIFDLSKENLSCNPLYLEFSMGVFYFAINDKFNIENEMEDEKKEFSTIEEAYIYLLDYIQQHICKHLDADLKSVCNQDVLVLNMINC